MDRKIFYTAATIIGLGLTSCTNEAVPTVSAITPTITPPPTEFTPTNLFQTRTVETIMPIVEPTKTVPERFKLGSFDVGNTAFKVDMPMTIMEPMGFTKPRNFELHKPLQVLVDYVPFVGDGGVGDQFNSGGWELAKLFLTERQNILMMEAHSESISALGEVSRIIGSWVRKNPGEEEKIYGKNIIITPDGMDPINAELVFAKTVTREEYEDHVFWGIYTKRENIILFNTKTSGIPDEIRKDNTPGVYYLILISCMPEGGNQININPLDTHRYSFNTDERAITVFKIVDSQEK